MQLFSERIINLWNKCKVRAIILLSLVLQIILVILGNRRKLTARFWIRIIVWSAYLSADWVATVALGGLARTIGDSEDSTHVPTNALQEFWAPFLLLHLGGPDTITAYSLEDNELWLRHFLGLIIQVGVAFYVFLRSWGNTYLTFLTIPIFISGVIKYCERTFILRSSSSEHFRDSLPSTPDLCQDFVKVTEQDTTELESLEGLTKSLVEPHDGIHPKDRSLILAYFLFERSKFFFAERNLDEKERKRIYSIFEDKESVQEAFKLVAVELGFMYDVLYTKAAIVYSRLGIVLRCITIFSSVSASVVFSAIIDTHVYPFIDVFITYLLLFGAVLLELYALILLFSSDWAKLWLIKLKISQNNPFSKPLANLFGRFFDHSQSLLTGSKRWSETMGQYNLICSCLKKVQPACIQVQKLPFMGKLLESKFLTWNMDVNIDHHLREKILRYLNKQGHRLNKDDRSYLRRDLILRRRGNFALRKRYNFNEMNAYWCTFSLEFVDSLIIWHIATDICYYVDLDNIQRGDVDSNRKISKYLSDYMLYILVFRPSMLPKGIGEVRYKETCAEATKLFKQKRDDEDDISSETKACKALLQKYNPGDLAQPDDFREEEFSMSRSQSLLKFGCILFGQLQNKAGHDYKKKWEIISDVWVEMVTYAAHSCKWKEHAQRLRNGGELLTHVRLLMAHFGLSKQYFQNLLPQLTKLETETETETEIEASTRA
ncbi:hypothetical protein EZV62_003334 [Acer yangbiense]|uniref:DUF4220 domain-containing protein n=1 Tax=Acer yangbiense TaxID=1000413 RepID=A0A5C7IH88_9ROSI|nr:hypothetical protein EZV62_003334 [Acer yangbiense]